MIFIERKKEEGYTYDLEDVFGTLHIESAQKLDAEILDGMVVLLLKQALTARIVEGEVKHEKGTVKYTFVKRPHWEHDDEEEQCEDTPTSTNEPESASTATPSSPTPTSNWLRQFVEAFREAWRSTRNRQRS